MKHFTKAWHEVQCAVAIVVVEVLTMLTKMLYQANYGSVVVHTCNPNARTLVRQKDLEFKVILTSYQVQGQLGLTTPDPLSKQGVTFNP